MNKHLLSWIKNEKGVTLLEILAGMIIFMLVILPMSDVYINGINLYNKMQAQTNLRNEADYVLSIVMKEIQDATYYELRDNTSTQIEQGKILDVLEDEDIGDLSVVEDLPPDNAYNRDNYQTDLVTYKLKVERNPAGETVSKVTKQAYTLLPGHSNTLYESDSYLAYGLFKLDKKKSTDTNDPNNHKISVYLLIVPKGKTGKDPVYLGNQQSTFLDLDQILKALESDPPFDYIRMVKTEISTNNVNQG